MKILLADDHPLTLQGTKNFVESLGYNVIDICTNGVSALNSIKLHSPDVAILDINMPGLDGLDVAKKVFENKLKTKIILLTMHKEMTIYNKAKEYNIYGYILKLKLRRKFSYAKKFKPVIFISISIMAFSLKS